MQLKNFRKSLKPIITVLLLASLFPLLAAYLHNAYLNDDTYITLTYAKNLSHGRGFVFNYPPATLGTTTPLFTLVIATFAWIIPWVDAAIIAVFFTAACWLGIIWLIFFFREQWNLKKWEVAVLGLVVIGSGWIRYLGMEAYLFAFLLVLSVSLFYSGRYLLTGLFMGLLFLTRGEGALVLVIILAAAIISYLRQYKTISYLRKRKYIQFERERKSINISLTRTIIKIIIGFAIPILCWFIYAYYTFGNALPNTLAAKQAQGKTGFWPPFLQSFTNEWIPTWGELFGIKLPFINLWWVDIWWIIVVLGIVTALLQKPKWLVFAGWIILYILGYTLLNVAAYTWYQLPILFVLQLFFGLGIIKLIELLLNFIGPNKISISISVLLVTSLVFMLSRPAVDDMLNYQGDSRKQSYMDLSQWFREHSKKSESIAYIEVGYIGYYTNNRIIDLAGLTLPENVSHIAKRDFAWGFWHYRPDYYIYLPDFDWALSGIRANPIFDELYKPIAALPGPRQTDFVIYKRIGK